MQNRTLPLRSVDAIDAKINQFDGHIASTEAKIIPIFNPSTFQEIREKIAEKKSESKAELFFTKDADLLAQYYELRAEAYSKEWGFESFDKSETNHDKQSKIVVAVKNGKVIGGSRIMFSDTCDYLSNEVPGTQYDYKKFIRKYDDRENLVIAEISAIVVADGNRDASISSAMFDLVFDSAKKHGCHYVFGVTLPLICRSYRMTLRHLGYDLEIIINYPWERKKIYNFVTMFPIYVKLC